MTSSSFTARTKKGKDFKNSLVGVQKKIEDAHAARLREAALLATQVSRKRYLSKRSKRPTDRPVGPGRSTTMGQFPSFIEWTVRQNAVRFEAAKLKQQAWYYLINEIGTGNTAKVSGVTVDGRGNISGNTTIGYPKQRGRYISPRLLWAPGMGGDPQRTKGRRGMDQLYPGSMLDQTKLANWASSRHRIRREIKAKHYIREGGRRGFGLYSNRMRADVKRILK